MIVWQTSVVSSRVVAPIPACARMTWAGTREIPAVAGMTYLRTTQVRVATRIALMVCSRFSA